MTAAVFAAVRADLDTAGAIDAARRTGGPVDLSELDALLSDAAERIADLRGLIHADQAPRRS